MIALLDHFLAMADRGKWNMQPTLIFNEGWLLRMVMDFAAQNREQWRGFLVLPEAQWFSEGLLPSPFAAVRRGDSLAEAYTHADGVIGSITVGGKGRGDVILTKPCEQLLVLEAKIASRLSAGTRNAPGYNQAARNVACMAEMIRISNVPVSQYKSLEFYVLAPAVMLRKEKSFTRFMDRQAIRARVEERVEAYRRRDDYGGKRQWFEEWFLPLISIIELKLCSWEELVAEVEEKDEATGFRLEEFYRLCLQYNGFLTK